MDKNITLCCCIYCHEERNAHGIYTHVDRTHLKLTKYSNGHNGKYKQISRAAKRKAQEKAKKYLKHPRYCIECNNILDYDNRKNKFCSHSCSAIFSNKTRKKNGWKHSVESKEKIREGMISYNLSIDNVLKPRGGFNKKCENCNTYFLTIKVNQKCCSGKCAGKLRTKKSREAMEPLKRYRQDAKFKFSLNDYPDKFDFYLIEKYGWYKATNHGNNLNGISRDHMISIRYGFDNNIDPTIIAHPANCKLIKQSENSSKHSKCSITIEELLERIKNWNKI